MSLKRQRFFVEVREDEVAVVSWKKLLAEAGQSPIDPVDKSVTGATPPESTPPPPPPPVAAAPTGDDPKKESLKSARRKSVKSDADERKMTEAAVKQEIVKTPIMKRKVRRSHNIGAKLKQTKACFSCSKKTKTS